MVRIALCDDDAAQLEGAANTLRKFAKSHAIEIALSTFASITELLASDDLADFNIAFMDIEFDGRPEGIEAVRRINELAPRCQVVYLTNYIQYSVDVYSTDHVWFVVKSQFEQRLPEVFEKLARIESARRAFIVVNLKDGGVLNISCRDILYLERRKRITYIATAAGVNETPEKLADILHRLPPTSFAHCHSSFVANLPRVTQIHATELSFDNGKTIPISRRYAKRFRDQYFEWAEQWTV